MPGEPSDNPARFPTTRWSLVARAGCGLSEEERREALGELFRRYAPALHAHLLSKGITADRAEELVQGFVVDKVIERNILATAERERGRFRAFLVISLDNYAKNRLRYDTAAKRAPGPGAKVLDVTENQDAAQLTVEYADKFDTAWARQVLADALMRMQEECRQAACEHVWRVFDARVLAPICDGVPPLAYDELVRRYGYASPAKASNVLITAKRMFDRNLRAVVADYLVVGHKARRGCPGGPGAQRELERELELELAREVEQEICSLRDVLSRAAPAPGAEKELAGKFCDARAAAMAAGSSPQAHPGGNSKCAPAPGPAGAQPTEGSKEGPQPWPHAT